MFFSVSFVSDFSNKSFSRTKPVTNVFVKMVFSCAVFLHRAGTYMYVRRARRARMALMYL